MIPIFFAHDQFIKNLVRIYARKILSESFKIYQRLRMPSSRFFIHLLSGLPSQNYDHRRLLRLIEFVANAGIKPAPAPHDRSRAHAVRQLA